MTLRTTLSLGLLAAALVLLGVGGFVQLDDTSGFGSDRWNVPLGLLAGLLAAAGLGAGVTGDQRERRTTGWALATLATCVLAVDAVTPGFMFVWGETDGAGTLLEAALVAGALALLLPGRGRVGRRGSVSTGTWAAAWLGGLTLATVAGFGLVLVSVDGLAEVLALYVAAFVLVLGLTAWLADGVRRARRI